MSRSRVEYLRRQLGIGLAVALVYVAAAELGFRVAVVAEQVTTVWAPTGIAQAALLLWGLSLWPAVWVAAFVANALTHVPGGVAAGIATGNTLEAVVAGWALRRMLGFDPSLTRTRDSIAFIAVAVATSTMVCATLGTAVLCAGGIQPWSRFWDLWPDWWLGDAVGSLVVAPVLLTTLRSRVDFTRRRVLEMVGWVSAAMATTEIVFGQSFISTGHFPLAFTIFPFVIVAAVRLGQPATALVIAGTAGVTLWNTTHGSGPFMESPIHERLVLVQAFMGVLGGSGLLLAAAIAERRVIERRRSATYEVGDVLGRSASLDEAAPRILDAIARNLDWQIGALWIVDRSINALRSVSLWAADDTPAPAFTALTSRMTFQRGIGLPGRVWATGHAIWIQDVVDDGNFPRAAIARTEGLHGAFGFPIRMGTEVLGVVELFNRSVSAPDQDLLATMTAMGNDIGQFVSRKSSETTATDSERRTHAILETALDAIITMDHLGAVTEFNVAAERMFGRRRQDVVGREMAELIIPQSLRESHRRGLSHYLMTGHGPFIDRRVETKAVRADGSEFPVEISITRVPTHPPLFTGFVRDMTERAEGELERRRLLEQALIARREAERANRAKDEFLATLSHELRTPLNAIVGWTRMLLDGTLDQGTARRALEIIDRNAQTQAQLVADILDVSRIITGKLTLDIRPVDLGAIIGVVLDGVRPAAEAKHIRLRSSFPSAASRVTAGDPQRLQQIVWNLVANAMKFTPQGGHIDVEISDCGEKSICVKVADSGMGIAPEFLEHVFERFRQADSSSTRQHGGLGLGLAIVRHLVELHGGTVRAESEGAGKGAVFIVELPRTADGHAHQPRMATALAAGFTAGDEQRLSGCRVLIVDDKEDARELLAALLQQYGAVVDSVTSVAQALVAVSQLWPDVLLSDIGLGQEDGYVLIREIRRLETEGQPHLPAAAVTAYARQEDRDRAMAAGFDRYITKPIEPTTLIETVHELWKRHLAQ